MPTLQVRELPDELYGALKREAQREHRSLTQQAVVVLARGLGLDQDRRERRQRVISGLKTAPPLPAGQRRAPVTAFIREDRRR